MPSTHQQNYFAKAQSAYFWLLGNLPADATTEFRANITDLGCYLAQTGNFITIANSAMPGGYQEPATPNSNRGSTKVTPTTLLNLLRSNPTGLTVAAIAAKTGAASIAIRNMLRGKQMHDQVAEDGGVWTLTATKVANIEQAAKRQTSTPSAQQPTRRRLAATG